MFSQDLCIVFNDFFLSPRPFILDSVRLNDDDAPSLATFLKFDKPTLNCTVVRRLIDPESMLRRRAIICITTHPCFGFLLFLFNLLPLYLHVHVATLNDLLTRLPIHLSSLATLAFTPFQGGRFLG